MEEAGDYLSIVKDVLYSDRSDADVRRILRRIIE
jgi:hypothetical protein